MPAALHILAMVPSSLLWPTSWVEYQKPAALGFCSGLNIKGILWVVWRTLALVQFVQPDEANDLGYHRAPTLVETVCMY